MNIETANRLYELRKKNGLSQEELADKLGISRQAVSKWERAEASPDTDNLILLAKLYGVTLDELLNSSAAEELAMEDSLEKDEDIEPTKKEEPKKDNAKSDEEKKNPVADMIAAISLFGVGFAYVLIGFTVPKYGWSCYWVLFLLVPIIASIIDAVKHKRICKFLYPVVVVFVYCFIGIRFSDYTFNIFGSTFYGLWHPMWVLFLTIPLFYGIAGPIDNIIHKGEEDTDED